MDSTRQNAEKENEFYAAANYFVILRLFGTVVEWSSRSSPSVSQQNEDGRTELRRQAARNNMTKVEILKVSISPYKRIAIILGIWNTHPLLAATTPAAAAPSDATECESCGNWELHKAHDDDKTRRLLCICISIIENAMQSRTQHGGWLVGG